MSAAPIRRSWRVGLVGLALASLVSACSAPPAAPPSPPSVAATTPTAVPSGTQQGRPLQPVPDVRPAGFADPPPGTGLARYQQQRLSWQPCVRDLLCASALVPLDYADPDGTAITLALAKRPATARERLGSLFINPGGPGGSGRGYLGGFNAKGLERYDIVGWDPRGVGGSTPVRCYGSADLDRYFSVDVSPDNAGEEQRVLAETFAFGQSCLAQSGKLLEHVSTAETVRDLDLLRGLVGDQQLHYFGASYGTKIGALYAQLFPAQVGRLVLDGAVNISGQEVSQIEGFERALGHFAEWSAIQTKLGASRAEVLQQTRRVLDGLDQTPLKVPAGRVLSQQQGVQGVIDALYDRSSWPSLARALSLASRGDGRNLLALADSGNFRNRDGSYGQIDYSFPAVRCRDSRESSVAKAKRTAKQLVAKAPVLGPLAGPDLVCPLWPVPPAPKEPKITGDGAAPILVLGTTGDPATPYENAVGMARQLKSGLLVTLEGEGHTAYDQSDCVSGIVRSYLVEGTTPADGVRCRS